MSCFFCQNDIRCLEHDHYGKITEIEEWLKRTEESL